MFQATQRLEEPHQREEDPGRLASLAAGISSTTRPTPLPTTSIPYTLSAFPGGYRGPLFRREPLAGRYRRKRDA
jgi:hypothetical protein